MLSVGMLRKGSADLQYAATSTDIDNIVGKQHEIYWQVADLTMYRLCLVNQSC